MHTIPYSQNQVTVRFFLVMSPSDPHYVVGRHLSFGFLNKYIESDIVSHHNTNWYDLSDTFLVIEYSIVMYVSIL